MNHDSTPNNSAPARPLEAGGKRKKRFAAKPQSRKQRLRARESFFLNSAQAFSKAIIMEFRKTGDWEKAIETVASVFQSEIARYTAVSICQKFFSGSASEMRRRLKKIRDRGSSLSREGRNALLGLAVLAGGEPGHPQLDRRQHRSGPGAGVARAERVLEQCAG